MKELQCANQTKYLLSTVKTRSSFDVDTILRNNIENGLTYNFNDFEKCMTLKDEETRNEIEGKYCIVQYNSVTSHNQYSGLCYPKVCDPKIVEAISRSSLEDLEKNMTDHSCLTWDVELNAFDFIAIIFFIVLMLVVIACSFYDYINIRKRKTANKWPKAFSLYTNIRRIFANTQRANKKVNSLYAIRTLSILWLIVSDRFNLVSKYAVSNEDSLENWTQNGFSSFLVGSDVGYDSLFIVAGFMLALYCFRAYSMKSMEYLPLLVHRYVRYMPMIALSLIYHLTLMKFFVNGPLSHVIKKRIENCEKYGFAALLIVENFMHAEKLCLFHGWFFSIDFQFFILLPILIYFCHKSRKIGFIVMGTFTAFIYAVEIYVIIDSKKPYDVFLRNSVFHMHSYFRCAPWFASIILASLCKEREVKMSKKFRVINTIASILIIAVHFIYTYLLQNQDIAGDEVLVTAIYAAFHRVFWSAAICWIIFYCYQVETTDCFQRILNLDMWRPLAKLALSMLIVYPIYQNSIVYNRPAPFFFDSWEIFHLALGDILMTLFLAIMLNASVEIPFVLIEHLIYEKRKNRKIRRSRTIEIQTIDPKDLKS